MSTITSVHLVNDPGEDGTPSRTGPAGRPGESVAEQLVDGQFLDWLFDKVDAAELQLTGEGGSCPTAS
jgi:hypothetical protein